MSVVGQVVLGDPVPWFSARDIFGGVVDLHLAAGRWIMLAFFGSLDDALSQHRMGMLLRQAALTSDDHMVIYVVLGAPPNCSDALRPFATVLRFLADYDGSIGAFYGAHHSPRTVMLDPMLRAIANIPAEPFDQHDRVLAGLLRDLPAVDDSAGAPLTAPVLMVPRVFDFPLCEHLVALFDKIGGADSGFIVNRDGKPAAQIDHTRKSREDLLIVAPELRQQVQNRIVTRLLPAIELYFRFTATHMDRYIVACYDAAKKGHFFRHRDNLIAGVEHRRFAVSLNLNSGYDGCDLLFPEFGRRTYRAPAGGAIVFSCAALHEVTPITKGKRYAFLSFLYGEPDVTKSVENNALLQEIGVDYQAERHGLYAERMYQAELEVNGPL